MLLITEALKPGASEAKAAAVAGWPFATPESLKLKYVTNCVCALLVGTQPNEMVARNTAMTRHLAVVGVLKKEVCIWAEARGWGKKCGSRNADSELGEN